MPPQKKMVGVHSEWKRKVECANIQRCEQLQHVQNTPAVGGKGMKVHVVGDGSG